MNKTYQNLKKLQQRIIDRKEEIYHDTYSKTDSDYSKILFLEINKLFHLLFYGSVTEESFCDVIKTISQPEVSINIESLIIHEADEGANGTMDLDFAELVDSKAIFSKLKYLYIQPYHNRWHNHPIIGWSSGDKKMVSKVIKKMQNLEALTIPNAPDKDFFNLNLERAFSLNVYCGYESHNFIPNLSHCSNLPKLKFLQFGEYNERYMDEYPLGCTAYEHYVELFQSQAFSNISRFILRHSILSEDEIEKLKKIRKPSKYKSFDVPSDGRPVKQQHLIFDFA